MIKQKFYLLFQNLDQFSNLNMDLELLLLHLIDICYICSFKPDLICCNSFALS